MMQTDQPVQDTSIAAIFAGLSKAMRDLGQLTADTETDILRNITSSDAQGRVPVGIQNLDYLQQSLAELAAFCAATPEVLEGGRTIDPLVASLRLERLRDHFVSAGAPAARASANIAAENSDHSARVMLFDPQDRPLMQEHTGSGPALDRMGRGPR